MSASSFGYCHMKQSTTLVITLTLYNHIIVNVYPHIEEPILRCFFKTVFYKPTLTVFQCSDATVWTT